MYTTKLREEGEVGTDRCTHHRLINRQRDSQQLYREEGEVGTDRCTQHRTIDRQRDSSQLDRVEGEVGTERCTQHRTKDRQRDSQIERKRRQVQIDVYKTKKQIDRVIVS